MSENHTLLKNFRHYFVLTFICVILCYFVLAVPAIGYDEGMNTTQIAFVCSRIMDFLLFSIPFWDYLNFSGIFIILFSFLTTTFVITLPFVILINWRFYKKSKQPKFKNGQLH
ncbi:MAG TPA: hypothetical protein PLP27_03105 [Crocinitomicaceae bacterium]|nr:hypothetical protein [Crocinitomicaceae bacterium]